MFMTPIVGEDNLREREGQNASHYYRDEDPKLIWSA